MVEIINNLDISILNFIRNNFSNLFMDKLMVVITSLGDRGLIWIAMALILLAIKKYRKIGIILLIALLITSLIGEGIIKNIVQRPRAFLSYPDIRLLINPPESFSFPSGHTASSFAAAFVLSHYFKKWNFLFYFLAILIAFSRLYLFVHYPSDIIFGIIL
ncbi:MAG: phosphatase PAP2 family protein, partial [Clostridium sp.]|uniref:phosphatase PAP2 family protein n=1 Tax=Clostridium sp. TaxID=1506 RepID=UPI0025BE9EEC